MFFNKKKACFHEWKVSDFRVSYYDAMFEADKIYELTCKQCKKRRVVDEYEYKQMESQGFIIQ
jgi:hypothetical protein